MEYPALSMCWSRRLYVPVQSINELVYGGQRLWRCLAYKSFSFTTEEVSAGTRTVITYRVGNTVTLRGLHATQ